MTLFLLSLGLAAAAEPTEPTQPLSMNTLTVRPFLVARGGAGGRYQRRLGEHVSVFVEADVRGVESSRSEKSESGDTTTSRYEAARGTHATGWLGATLRVPSRRAESYLGAAAGVRRAEVRVVVDETAHTSDLSLDGWEWSPWSPVPTPSISGSAQSRQLEQVDADIGTWLVGARFLFGRRWVSARGFTFAAEAGLGGMQGVGPIQVSSRIEAEPTLEQVDQSGVVADGQLRMGWSF